MTASTYECAWANWRVASCALMGLLLATGAGFAIWTLTVERGLHTAYFNDLPKQRFERVNRDELIRCYEQHHEQVLERFGNFEFDWSTVYMRGNDSIPGYQLLYFPVLKAMSSTMRSLMGEYGLTSPEGEPWHFGGRMQPHYKLTAENMTEEQTKYLSFTFVRDPIERQLHGFLQTAPGAIGDAEQINEYAHQFAARELEEQDIHRCPALYLLFRFSSRHLDYYDPPDFIGKVENASEHLKDLMAEMERRHLHVVKKVNHVNVRPKLSSAWSLLTPESMRLMCETLCFDYKCLSYEMPPECTGVSC